MKHLSRNLINMIVVTLLGGCLLTGSFAETNTQSVQKNIAELKAFVNSGLKEIKIHGEEKAYKKFNDPKGAFIKDDLYLFVFSFNGKVLAHGDNPKKFVGKNLFNAKDEFGIPYFQLFVEAANRGGGIVSYYWPRPKTGLLQYKTSYIAPINDKAFIGAGIYKSLKASKSQEEKINELKQFVDSGIEYVKQKGEAEAYKEFNKQQGKFRKKDLYIFVCQYDGLALAHGGDPKNQVDKNISALLDEFDTPIFKMFMQAVKAGGGVASYYWQSPEKGIILFKTSYVKPLNKKAFIGAGYYSKD